MSGADREKPVKAGAASGFPPVSEAFSAPLSGSHAPSGRGFTLIELLIVVLLLGTVMTVIMASFEGGLRVYDRISGFGTGEMEVYLAGEAIARDLKNAIQTDGIVLTGEPDAIEMLTVATLGESAGQSLLVRYHGAVSGVQRSMSLLSAEGRNASVDSVETILGPGFSINLRYQGTGQGPGPGSAWSDSWAGGTNLPVAVQIEIAGDALVDGPVVRTVLLETAGGEEEP